MKISKEKAITQLIALHKILESFKLHWYGDKIPQEEDALIDAGVSVKAKLVYYSVLGYLVELGF